MSKGRYKPYPEYSKFGEDWLSAVPSHWRTKRLKHVTTHNDEVLDEATRPDTEILYVDISSVDSLSGIRSKELLQFSIAPSRARRRVRHGDVIVSTVRTYLRAIARIRYPERNLIVSTGFAVVRPRAELVSDFLGYLLSTSFFVEEVVARSTGVSYPAINATDLVGIPAPIPPLPEQTQIAKFLDHETAKIDRLIEKQEALIRLLKEKRQAVISHAVTKGLNPHAPLKDSGIPWLGQVPAHWVVASVRYITREHKQGYYTNDTYVDEGTPLLRVTDIKDDASISFDNCPKLRTTTSERRQFELSVGDFVFVRSGATVGKFGVVDRKTDAIFGSYCIRFSFRESFSPGFLKWSFQSQTFTDGLFSLHHGGAIKNVNADNIKDQVLAYPRFEEQKAIAKHLETTAKKFGRLLSQATRAITLLQERRTALISAAVTGKIDVRDWQPGPA